MKPYTYSLSSQWIEVQGRMVELRSKGAKAHADMLTRRYTGKGHFYGGIYPVKQRTKETREIVHIEVRMVLLDTISR